ncbi:MAG: translation initiation factor IF-3 [Verrucomicrobiota bacterium JB023]|nr:translation initiation factor IF-3 [Verrucomicrobiota bacterium JB023]
MNEKIRANRVRVVAPDGKQMGVMDLRDAVREAKARGLTLVEIAAKADPPVCRIVDYGKWRYEQSKLKKNKAKAVVKMKEVKFRVRTEEHDYNIKLGRIESFLGEGHKVRVFLQFRGRENAHKELGVEMLQRVRDDLKTMANCDQQPRLAGRSVSMILSPLPKEQQKRKFKLFHGDLIDDDDDFDDEDEDDEEHDDANGEDFDGSEEGSDEDE